MVRLSKDEAYLAENSDKSDDSKNMKSTIELKQLELTTSLGTYSPNDVVPDVHLLDLTLTIDPKLSLISTDGIDYVFDYDPLIKDIDRLASELHYHTQERLITRIVDACAAYKMIEALELCLSKRPVLRDSGELGIRLILEAVDLMEIREPMGD